MSGVTVERNGRNLRTSTLNAMVSELRVSGGQVYDEEESQTWSLDFGWAGDG